ncbi:MAG: hypothetical protein R3A13_09205 [Bdellovibrionota bacterium]
MSRAKKRKKEIVAVYGSDQTVNVKEFNLEFWQKCSDHMKMESAWDLVVQAWKVKGRDPRELRLQRHIAVFKPA